MGPRATSFLTFSPALSKSPSNRQLLAFPPSQALPNNADAFAGSGASRMIPAGHRIRVTVASAGFPKYDRNLNTGGDNERDTKHVVARQRILHDSAHQSFVRLPLITR
jgi:predicted acyl esterase